MYQNLKERLVGATVLVVIAVIFIPMLLTGSIDSGSITKTNIPERPGNKFELKLVPIAQPPKARDIAPPEITSNPSRIEDKTKPLRTDTEADTEHKTEADTEHKKEKLDNIIEEKQLAESIVTVQDKQISLSAWVIQLGSFYSKANADKLNLNLRKAGFPAFVESITKENKTVYKVRVGPELLRSDADIVLKNIKNKMKLDGIVLSYP